jgi:hypothetical protein
VSIINGEASSSTLVEGFSLPWLKTPQKLEEITWAWRDLKIRATKCKDFLKLSYYRSENGLNLLPNSLVFKEGIAMAL